LNNQLCEKSSPMSRLIISIINCIKYMGDRFDNFLKVVKSEPGLNVEFFIIRIFNHKTLLK